GDHAAGTRADVGKAAPDAIANHLQEFSVVERLQKTECVAAADEDGVCFRDVFHDVETHAAESLAHFCDVGIMIVRGEWNERHALAAGQQTPDLRLWMIEESVAVNV